MHLPVMFSRSGPKIYVGCDAGLWEELRKTTVFCFDTCGRHCISCGQNTSFAALKYKGLLESKYSISVKGEFLTFILLYLDYSTPIDTPPCQEVLISCLCNLLVFYTVTCIGLYLPKDIKPVFILFIVILQYITRQHNNNRVMFIATCFDTGESSSG
jgi:hypothetical protein